MCRDPLWTVSTACSFLCWQVIGTSELIVRPGLINVDFADVRQVITNSGTALIGIGTGSGKVRGPTKPYRTVCIP